MPKRITVGFVVSFLLTLCVSTAFAFDIASHSPAANASVGDPDINITVEFDDDVDPATVMAANWILWTSGGQEGISVSLDVDGRTVIISPSTALSYGSKYYFYGNRGIENVIGDEWLGYVFIGFTVEEACVAVPPEPCICGTVSVVDTCGSTQEVDCGACRYAVDECEANVCISPFADDMVVTIPNANLRAKVREDIGKAEGDITYEDVKGIQIFNGNMRGIDDIEGLQYFVSLEYLFLQYNQIEDISPLVNNRGISGGDAVFIDSNLFDCTDPVTESHMTTLLSKGVELSTDCTPSCIPTSDICYDNEFECGEAYHSDCPATPINCGVCTSQYVCANNVCQRFDPEAVCHFPDPNLEAVIRSNLGQPSGNLYIVDLQRITELYARWRNISDLSGMECLSNLVVLDLWDTPDVPITDLGPLSDLVHLTSLNLRQHEVSDLSPLMNLTNLTYLQLQSNEVVNITPLARLTNLNYLNLGGNNVSNIDALSGLTNLTELYLGSNNGIIDIHPLSELANLTYLDISNHQISDISPLSGLDNLTQLYIGWNWITDIAPISELTNLTRLDVYDNQINDISPLEGLTNLIRLNIGGNHVVDISSLSGLTNLTSLYLISNPISDISPLSGLLNLTVLQFGGALINDISPLSELINLTLLNLWGTNVNDINSLSGMTKLTSLDLSNNQIDDISPLSNLQILRHLSLRQNNITDISPLVANTRLSSNEHGLDDFVNLRENPLDCNDPTVQEDIAALEDRGVNLATNCP